ncbi:MAG: tripartite tricarboxylate transporter permease [Deltaproteobacteria bacterium]|nr:tripartite tricarboxylate transporter permease [Deltaproteobacteria bacterium]MBW2308021.1 tripartite tricarboxylate transporter permease [Deltaproteobacteria bacterium]
MELFHHVYNASIDLLLSVTILYTLLGGFIGTMTGALPGLGPSASLALFIPMTFGLNPIVGMVFLCNIYQGTMYGGRITSILANIPGDNPAIVTCFEGYPMAQKGRAGPAMGISGISSFLGGMVGLTGLMFFAGPVSDFAIRFGPPEYFGLMVFALSCIGILSGKSQSKGIAMAALGLLCATVGHDFVTGTIRLTYGIVELVDGIDLIPVSLGAFAVSQVLFIMEKEMKIQFIKTKLTLSNLYPSMEELFRSKWPVVRGSLIGFLVGVLPGAGGTPATFISYAVEKKVSKRSDEFGTGMVEGLAAPESSNNSSEGGALIPLLTLGVPGSGGTAILLGGLMIWGIRPGPLLFQQNPEFIWYIIAGLLLGNLGLLILNVGFIPLFVTMLRMVQPYLLSAITVLCITGVYAYSFSFFAAWVMLLFGGIGYFARKLDYPMAPLVLGLVLGPRTEDSLRQSMMMSQGSFSIFFEGPISAALLTVGLTILLYPLFRFVFNTAKRAIKKG